MALAHDSNRRIRSAARGVVVLVLFPTSASADRHADGPMILVVDRQPEVREPMRKTLEEAGYEGLEAADGAEACRGPGCLSSRSGSDRRRAGTIVKAKPPQS